MSDIVLKVENVSKQYRLGQVGTGTISHDLNRWWHKVRGKEDPFLKVGDVNNREVKGQSDYVWALNNIDFEVRRGEVLGIVGKNGAGKSTLLKILSQVTTPTTGQIKIKGRIAALLEVGTGFHPELSGRENIFLNGAILGMTKAEIRSKFDEIVEFSGVGRYIDTPVKRYSSGMYVRLAFSVAAHLEPEILIIDEVLAVGDAEFQKKCLGKMKDVAGQGRTVLFVSHNMTAVNSLCSKCVSLKNGTVHAIGGTEQIVDLYLTNKYQTKTHMSWAPGNNPGDETAILHSVRLINREQKTIEFSDIDKTIGVEYVYEVLKAGSNPVPNVHVFTSKGEYAFVSNAMANEGLDKAGVHKAVMWIPENLLNEGTYIVGVALTSTNPGKVHFFEREALLFEVIEDINKRSVEYNQKSPGVIRPKLNWDTSQIR